MKSIQLERKTIHKCGNCRRILTELEMKNHVYVKWGICVTKEELEEINKEKNL